LFAGFPVVLVVVDIGGEGVLEEPEGADEDCGDDYDSLGERHDEGQAFVMSCVPKKALL
jgi:hypothetical protein